MRFLLSVASLSLAVSAVVVNGNESTGPRGQGNCALREGTFECSNGARCNYDDAANAFQCEGGTDEEEDSLESQGPPGKSCHSHGSHWDCDDGSFCEFENNVWTCQGEGGETSETGGPNCISEYLLFSLYKQLNPIKCMVITFTVQGALVKLVQNNVRI